MLNYKKRMTLWKGDVVTITLTPIMENLEVNVRVNVILTVVVGLLIIVKPSVNPKIPFVDKQL